MATRTWRELLTAALKEHGETWEDAEGLTMARDDELPWGEDPRSVSNTDAELDREFDNGFGAPEGACFTLWTKRRVYFANEYDGAESVASVPRNPCDEACRI